MSHFSVLVLLNAKQAKDVEGSVARLLAPYDEGIPAVPYPEPCYCIGQVAESAASEHANKKCKHTLQELRDAYDGRSDDPLRGKWQDFIKPWTDARDKHLSKSKLKDKPDPECEDCDGTGTHMSTYNPNSQWDWWVIGGRWAGLLLGNDYNPYTDPKNQEKCWICNGTGRRDDLLGREVREKDPSYTCNGCGGKGECAKWNSEFVVPAGGNQRMVSEIPAEVTTFAVVTPDGGWHQRGKMGWFGSVREELSDEDWQKIYREMISNYSDCLAVVVDCHI